MCKMRANPSERFSFVEPVESNGPRNHIPYRWFVRVRPVVTCNRVGRARALKVMHQSGLSTALECSARDLPIDRSGTLRRSCLYEVRVCVCVCVGSGQARPVRHIEHSLVQTKRLNGAARIYRGNVSKVRAWLEAISSQGIRSSHQSAPLLRRQERPF